MRRGLLSGALAAAVLSSLGPSAWAQASERKGFFIGGSVGLGSSSPDLCTGCGTGLAVGGRLGAMLKPNLGLLLELDSLASAPTVPSDVVGRHTSLLAAAQYWPSRRIWLKAGAGAVAVQRTNPAARYDESTTHFGGLAGVGVEINPGSAVVVELALVDLLSGDTPGVPRAVATESKSTANSVIFKLGVTWYHR